MQKCLPVNKSTTIDVLSQPEKVQLVCDPITRDKMAGTAMRQSATGLEIMVSPVKKWTQGRSNLNISRIAFDTKTAFFDLRCL